MVSTNLITILPLGLANGNAATFSETLCTCSVILLRQSRAAVTHPIAHHGLFATECGKPHLASVKLINGAEVLRQTRGQRRESSLIMQRPYKSR